MCHNCLALHWRHVNKIILQMNAEGAAVAGEGGLSEALAAAHAAELASMHEAFLARTEALQEDLQV
jgi:hypothetical protein